MSRERRTIAMLTAEGNVSLTFLRLQALLGAVVYPAWSLIYQWLLPAPDDPFWERGAVACVMLAHFALTWSGEWYRRRAHLFTYSIMSLMTAHLYWLVFRNGFHFGYQLGYFILLCALAPFFFSMKNLLWYSALVVAMLPLAMLADVTADLWIFVSGVLTILSVTLVALLYRITLRDQLHQSRAEIAALLDNMPLAVFAVRQDWCAVEPISRHSQAIFGENIAGRSLMDTLFASSAHDSEAYSLIRSVAAVVFGEDEMQWAVMGHHLPTRVELRGRQLNVRYSPLWSKDGLLNEIVCVVEDVTEIERLQRENQAASTRSLREISILTELMTMAPAEQAAFFAHGSTKLASCGALLAKAGAGDLDHAFRILHTLKGEARMQQMSLIASEIHQVETRLSALRTYATLTPEESASLAAGIRSIQDVYGLYATLAAKVFRITPAATGGDAEAGGDDAAAETVAVLDANIVAVERAAAPLTAHHDPGVRVLAARARELRGLPAVLMTRGVRAMCRDIAASLGKEVEVYIVGEDTLVDGRLLSDFKEIVLHVLRNSIDHGIESGADRAGAGKPRHGTISIAISREHGATRLAIKDDGRGIVPRLVADKAVSRGLLAADDRHRLSDRQVIELIFAPAFSTSDRVTEISGRGIGLDVVKTSVERLSGTIVVNTEPGKGAEFVIEIPDQVPPQILAAA